MPMGEELRFVPILSQTVANDARRLGTGMPPVLLEDQREVLADELRPRNAAIRGGLVEEFVHPGVEGDGGRSLMRKCHTSTMTLVSTERNLYMPGGPPGRNVLRAERPARRS